MNYAEAMAYLYNRLPVFHQVGARAYKPGLETTRAFCQHLGNPQNSFSTLHIAGTNGKGSVSNMLAAILQTAGYKTGLYTSPHLKSFTERIRINGIPVSETYIADFVQQYQGFIESINPSFFEVTVAMAFDYFAKEEVDIAVIEVGMGGRLDSTNIITPVLSLITNIGMDHIRQLGDTLPAIAREKAGIIKEGIPVVVSERQDPEIAAIFEEVARHQNAPIFYGSDFGRVEALPNENGLLPLEISYSNKDKYPNSVRIDLDLQGNYQKKNVLGVLCAVDLLNQRGWGISEVHVRNALSQVAKTTGFRGRWTQLASAPLVIADTGHNLPGFSEAVGQFLGIPSEQRHFVIGFVNDKDITSLLSVLPTSAKYYFCAPSNIRALAPNELKNQAAYFGLVGNTFSDVNEALNAALRVAGKNDSIYVGGSTFVVADLADL